MSWLHNIFPGGRALVHKVIDANFVGRGKFTELKLVCFMYPAISHVPSLKQVNVNRGTRITYMYTNLLFIVPKMVSRARIYSPSIFYLSLPLPQKKVRYAENHLRYFLHFALFPPSTTTAYPFLPTHFLPVYMRKRHLPG